MSRGVLMYEVWVIGEFRRPATYATEREAREAAALAVARMRNERAIYHLATGETVYV